MKINQLENFIRIVDSGSINKAAEQYYISQPNLSRSIQSLEEELGKALLIRSNHGVTMTSTGQMLYYYGKSILNELHVLEQLKYIDDVQMYAKLSVSVAGIFLQDDIIMHCYKELCAAETEIQVQETTPEGVLEDVAVLRSELGVAILNAVQLPIFKKMAEQRNMEVIEIAQGPIYIHRNEQYTHDDQSTISFQELMGATYIHLPDDFFSNLNHSIDFDGIQLSSFPKKLVMSNYHAMLNLAKHTDSFFVGNPWQVEELKHSHMHSFLLRNSPVTCHFIILKRKNNILSHASEIFVNILRKNYEKITVM